MKLRKIATSSFTGAAVLRLSGSLCMSSFAIKYPFFILMLCLGIRGGRSDHRGPHAGRPVSADPDSGGGGRHVLQRHAAAADRSRHHRHLRALLHPGQQHRPHRIAIAHRRQPDQGVLPAGNRSRRGGQRDCQSRDGRSAQFAAGHAASGGAEVRCLQPAGLPGDAERPGPE